MSKKKQSDKLPRSFDGPLATLASRPEFKVLEKLMQIEEQNILVRNFKLIPTDPQVAIKMAHLKGRVDELRRIRRTFEEALKKAKEE